MQQDELKRAAARAALAYVVPGSVIGVGTGSTTNHFIDALAEQKGLIAAAVASSEATRQRLSAHGISVVDLNQFDSLALYVDGADEIDGELRMIKGGGGALTREKIVAAVAERFVCIADASKRVTTLGSFPLPLEVLPMASRHVAARMRALGGTPVQRDGCITDNGNLIIDVHGLRIERPQELESEINQIAGLVTCGLFARRGADVLLLAAEDGVHTLTR